MTFKSSRFSIIGCFSIVAVFLVYAGVYIRLNADPRPVVIKGSNHCGLTGLYYGVSVGDFGQLAWLIRIEDNHAVLYSPPGNLISESFACESGEVTILTEAGLSGIKYELRGKIETDRIDFDIRLLNSRAEYTKFTSSLERIAYGDDEDAVSGRYSNVEYNAEGGDLVGEEVLLFQFKGSLVGIYVSYENDMSPYHIVVTKNNNALNMSVKRGKTPTEFTATILKSGLRMKRIGSSKDDPPSTLVKRESLSRTLRGAQ